MELPVSPHETNESGFPLRSQQVPVTFVVVRLTAARHSWGKFVCLGPP